MYNVNVFQLLDDGKKPLCAEEHQFYRACLVPCIHLNQAGGMQGPAVWLPAHLVEPGSARARGTPRPGSAGTSKSAVPAGPGSLDAAAFTPNDTISV